jgi:hypothetical protein
VAAVAASLTAVTAPSREVKRSRIALVQWFSQNWIQLYPLLSLMELRDAKETVVDGTRELIETLFPPGNGH